MTILGTPEDLRRSAPNARRGQLKGRQPSDADLALVRGFIGEPPLGPDGYPRDMLIEYLHRLNDAHGCLRKPHLVGLAQLMRLGMVEVMEVASFYHHFDILEADEAAPKLVIRVCDGLSCELAGARELRAACERAAPEGVGVRAAPCIGQCDHAPAAAVGQRVLGEADASKVLHAAQNMLLSVDFKTNHPSVAVFITSNAIDAGANEFQAYQANGGYATWQRVANGELNAAQLIELLSHAGLRGLGGAGFPAGRKWQIVREHAQRLQAKPLLVVNLDEGEPGTFKDRWCLDTEPHRMIEGMLIAAAAVGCEAVYVYLRDEYHTQRHRLQAALDAVRAAFPHATPIKLRRGAGAYICGEESALIESLEGKRGEPRLRPPYIAERGLFGRPTLAHNGETLYWLRELIERGPEFFANVGRYGRQGLRRFSVSGRVREPGVKLAPAGITLRELIAEHCGGMADGHELYAYLPGGASGGIFPASLADLPLDFDTLQPHGGFIGSAAIIVLGHTDRTRDAALNMMRFFAHESCGQCTPCRVGTAKAAQLMEANTWDAETLQDINQAMADASICGLGQAAPNPVACVLKYFPGEVGC